MTTSITRRRVALATVVGGMLVGALAAGTASADTVDDTGFDSNPDSIASSAINALDRASAELPECDFASIHLQNESEEPSWEVEMVCTDGDISQYVEVDAETSEVISINDDYTAGSGYDDDAGDQSDTDDTTVDDTYDDYTDTDTDTDTDTEDVQAQS